jgi:hypothetical protein
VSAEVNEFKLTILSNKLAVIFAKEFFLMLNDENKFIFQVKNEFKKIEI